MTAVALIILGTITLLVGLSFVCYGAERDRTEVLRLRVENARLMERIGYEYHMALGTPKPSVPLPGHADDHPSPRPFRMRPPRPLTREERAARAAKEEV